jgi:hypothetical protein
VSVIHNAQFELSVDGVPRSFRDRKDLALQAGQILKARNPNSVVKNTFKALRLALSVWQVADWLKFKNQRLRR